MAGSAMASPDPPLSQLSPTSILLQGEMEKRTLDPQDFINQADAIEEHSEDYVSDMAHS
jgi:hypothetical protein